MLERWSLGAAAAELDSSRLAAAPDGTGCVGADDVGSRVVGGVGVCERGASVDNSGRRRGSALTGSSRACCSLRGAIVRVVLEELTCGGMRLLGVKRWKVRTSWCESRVDPCPYLSLR